jgi:hypothetical protein
MPKMPPISALPPANLEKKQYLKKIKAGEDNAYQRY